MTTVLLLVLLAVVLWAVVLALLPVDGERRRQWRVDDEAVQKFEAETAAFERDMASEANDTARRLMIRARHEAERPLWEWYAWASGREPRPDDLDRWADDGGLTA